jgi:hypothetical protein
MFGVESSDIERIAIVREQHVPVSPEVSEALLKKSSTKDPYLEPTGEECPPRHVEAAKTSTNAAQGGQQDCAVGSDTSAVGEKAEAWSAVPKDHSPPKEAPSAPRLWTNFSCSTM